MNTPNILIDHLYHHESSLKDDDDHPETSQLLDTCAYNGAEDKEQPLEDEPLDEQPLDEQSIEEQALDHSESEAYATQSQNNFTFLQALESTNKTPQSSEECPVDGDYALLLHDDKVLFSCRHCELAYDNYISLKDHSMLKHGCTLQRKDCQHCLMILSSHNKLLLHLKEDHLNDLSSDQAEKLKKKFPQASSGKGLVCEKCTKSFASKASLLNHLRKFHSISEASNHHCTTCSITFSSPKELQQHNESLHNTRTFLCLECDSSFQSRNTLNLHNIYHHRVHRCTSCLILFHGRLALTNHVKQHHPGMPVYRADSRLVCEYCSQCFSVRSHLSDHIQSCHLGRVNQCEDCGKVLSTTETLKVHRLKHRPEKHRTCEHCGKQFYRTGMLTEHIRAVHSEMLSDEWRQRTTCPYCQTRFTRRESMRRHIEAKHESKRFLCSFCERPFTCRRYLVRHENKHHLGRPSS